MTLAPVLAAALSWSCSFDGVPPSGADADPNADAAPAPDGQGPSALDFGNGHDGVWDGMSPISVTSPLVTGIEPGGTGVVVDDSQVTIEVGDVIMVWQTALPLAMFPDETVDAVDLDDIGVGHYELRRVTDVAGAFATVAPPLSRTYTVPGAQVVLVPQYTELSFVAGMSPATEPWDRFSTRPPHGGIIAALVDGQLSNEINLNLGSEGFFGGQTQGSGDDSTGCSGLYEAPPGGVFRGDGVLVNSYGSTGRARVWNAGGSGVCQASGGGGGGGMVAGGVGGTSFDGSRAVGGHGGAQVLGFDPTTHLLLGGGGGAGHSAGNQNRHGGDGGGVILFIARSITGTGTFSVNGENGTNADGSGGGGGGGGGGTIYLLAQQAVSCNQASATGGRGGDSNSARGPGGGGSGGYVLIEPMASPCPVTARPGRAGRRSDLQDDDPNRCDGAGPYCCGDGVVNGPHELCEPNNGGSCDDQTCLPN